MKKHKDFIKICYIYFTFFFGLGLFKLNRIQKAVPLHAMEAHGGRGGIALTHI
jgi:hypothetical protein